MIVSHLFFLILGFILLIKGADMMVHGSIRVARRYHISDWVVGLTIVALGGSLPEMVVCLYAAAVGNTEIAISNILGSVTANVFLVLGVSAFVCTLAVKRKTLLVYMPLGILVTLVLGAVAVTGFSERVLTRLDGIFLLGCFLAFMAYTFMNAGREGEPAPHEKERGMSKVTAQILLGFLGLFIGSRWILEGSVALADVMGVSHSFIGFTVVAVGTSLPELAASAAAARRKNAEIAIANVVGSNIFNVLFILGMTAVVRPLPFKTGDIRDWAMAALAGVLLFLFLILKKRHVLNRLHGAVFLVIYLVYLGYLMSIQKMLIS